MFFFFIFLQKISRFLVSRNLFTYISVWRAVQLNVRKSDPRIVNCLFGNKCIPFKRVFIENGSWRCIYFSSGLKTEGIQINELLKKRGGWKILVSFFSSKFLYLGLLLGPWTYLHKKTRPIHIYPMRTSHLFNGIYVWIGLLPWKSSFRSLIGI